MMIEGVNSVGPWPNRAPILSWVEAQPGLATQLGHDPTEVHHLVRP
jgi:hypothetical protein